MKNIGDFLKKNNIIRVMPHDTLSSAVGQLSSSHDAAFVFDEDDTFLGVINPYHALISSSAYDGNTKVERAIFHPPHIHINDSLGRIARLMNDSKIHYLPLFDEADHFVGITSARRILAYMQQEANITKRIGQIAHTQKGRVITVTVTDPISHALSLFKEYKTSKVVAVDANGKLQGILSHYDLIPHILDKGRGSLKDTPVQNFIKTRVLTLSQDDLVMDAIGLVLSEEIGSVILIDGESQPVGVVTTRDLLDLLQDDKPRKNVSITTKHLAKRHQVTFNDFSTSIEEYIQNNDSLSGGSIVCEGEKNDSLFKLSVHLHMKRGEPIVISREGKDFSILLRNVKDVVRSTG